MEKALVFGTRDCGFESHQELFIFVLLYYFLFFIYRIAQIGGGRKLWRNERNLPIFYPA